MLTTSRMRSTASARNMPSCTATPAASRHHGRGSRVRTPSSSRPASAEAAASRSRRLDSSLARRGVHVDVLLAGEVHDLVHDLVGDRAQDVAVVLQALVAAEVQRLAEAHVRPRERAELLPGGATTSVPTTATGITGTPVSSAMPGDAGLAAVELAVVRAGALGVDAEQVTLGEDPLRGLERTLRGRGAGPVDRDLAGAREERLLQPALDARRGEVLRLRHEGHAARDGQRHEQPVGVREVVAGQDRSADLRNVLRDPRPSGGTPGAAPDRQRSTSGTSRTTARPPRVSSGRPGATSTPVTDE